MQYIAMLLLATTLVGGGYGMWNKIKLQAAEAEIQTLVIEKDAAVASQKAAETQMAFQAEQVQAFQEKNAQLQADAARAREAVDYTRKLFNDHDFAKLMAAKPGLITTRMQNASDKVLSDLQSVTK